MFRCTVWGRCEAIFRADTFDSPNNDMHITYVSGRVSGLGCVHDNLMTYGETRLTQGKAGKVITYFRDGLFSDRLSGTYTNEHDLFEDIRNGVV